jgi:hypothetical protein
LADVVAKILGDDFLDTKTFILNGTAAAVVRCREAHPIWTLSDKTTRNGETAATYLAEGLFSGGWSRHRYA